MSKLSKLKEWLTLEGAASVLTNAFSEQVGVSDIYQLALEGRVPLSVRLLMPIDVCHLLRAPMAMARRTPSLDGKRTVILHFILDEDTILKQDGARLRIVGVFDLAMLGAERVLLEQLYAHSIGSAEPDMVSLEMVFLRDGADGFYQLVNMFTLEMDKGEEPLHGYSSTACLPQDSQLVVRPQYLARLIDEASATIEKPSASQPFHSQRLTWLLHASRQFWEKTDRADKTTFVTNEVVARWLTDKTAGFTPTLSKHAATIIRPEWAEKGRPPEK